ncbi:hypothetical protein M422DRAFT_54124 [Sphaerobolus stellatus SS14]|uniref:CxC1-like cysteine cluster associated with KDZ transposases domain-containing protein n=1 Tax=Sphaerobolus stellatus (strain SS14) TaxID=990650 RepID=A0A0C9TIZ7_SPHS4|nr:hypothetical protein M422DRAFT_54124 [Sphaerobolus stellatus SS14]
MISRGSRRVLTLLDAMRTEHDAIGPKYWQMESLEAFDAPSPSSWSMRILDLHKSRILYFPTLDTDRWMNHTLLRYGCLGTAPLSPHSAFSLRTLSQYHEAHHVCPRLSKEAEIRAMCNINKTPNQKSLADQFRITYDAYFEILDRVQTQVNTVLGRDKPNWRALNVCPACDYRLEGEPSLKYLKLCSRVPRFLQSQIRLLDIPTRCQYAQEPTKPKRTAEDPSDKDMNEVCMSCIITCGLSNSFHRRLHNHWMCHRLTTDSDEEQDTLVGTEEPDDIADSASCVSVCTQQWQNAGPEE